MSTVKGIESFMEAVKKDCKKGNDCFNPNGCDKEFTKMFPEDNPRLIEMGITQKCMAMTKCTHKYCDKYAWVLHRAQAYADALGTTREKVLESWEEKRDYWYMNFYQEGNQPDISSNVFVFENEKDLMFSVGKTGFRCPKCAGVSTDAYECSCDNCDWKSYGLFGTMGKGANIVIRSSLKLDHVFMPIAWEKGEVLHRINLKK